MRWSLGAFWRLLGLRFCGKKGMTVKRLSFHEAWGWIDRRSGVLLALLLVLNTAVFTLAAACKMELFRMGFDTALIEQAIWNTVHGRFLETHAFDFSNNLLGLDCFYMAAWLAPLYALFPSVNTLFAAQMTIVSLGALPLYLLARDRLGRAPGLLVAILYLAYTPVQYGSLYEIRFRMMAMTWLAFLFLFVERQRYWGMLPFLFLALSCRLDTTIAVAMLGVYALLRRKPWYYGVTLLVAGASWYLVVTQVIIPHYSSEGYIFFGHYEQIGGSPLAILSTGLTRPLLVLQRIFTPGKLGYLFQMGIPLLFLPLLGLPAIIPAIPLFLINLLSDRSVQWDIYHHYQGLLVPFLMVGLILGWDWLSRQKGPTWLKVWQHLDQATRVRVIGLLLLVSSLGSNLAFRNPLPSIFFAHPPARLATARAILARIPPDVPVAASNLLAPHLPMRRDIFLVPGGDFHYAEHPEERAEYILLDLQSERGEEERALLEALRAQPTWEVLAEQDGYVLLRRRH